MNIHHYGNAALLLNVAPSLGAGCVYRIGIVRMYLFFGQMALGEPILHTV